MQIDEERALQILEEEYEKSQDDNAPVEWKGRIQQMCMMAETGASTCIAVFGTHALAKATDLDAHTLSINVGDRPGGYSARSFCQNVLAAERLRLGLDIGSTGREPFNNQPFYYSSNTYVDEIDVSNRRSPEAFTALIGLLEDLDSVDDEAKARQILRAFLQLRSISDQDLPEIDDNEIDEAALVERAKEFVNRQSEFGKRAQSMVAAIMDAGFGPDRVGMESIHDPDRHLPGDVVVYRSNEDEDVKIAIEVRDKPVSETDLYHAISKAVDDGVSKVCVVAVSQLSQEESESLAESLTVPSDLRSFAAARDAKIRVFTSWDHLIDEIAFWTDTSPSAFATRTSENLPTRAGQMDVSEEGVEWWVSQADTS